MAGIWNVNGIYELNTKKITGKLSFDIGETFKAKIINMKLEDGEILLKMLDGWKFSAHMEKPLDYMPEGLVRFQVLGFEDGKLKLAMVQAKDDTKGESKDDSSIKNVMLKLGIKDNDEMHDLLEKMVKHDMPLTRENISTVKTIMDFSERLKDSPEEADAFIQKFMQSKGIDTASQNGIKTAAVLKDFFNELKNVDADDVVSMLQNDIELTGDNIRSFNRIVNEPQVIYNDIKQLENVNDAEAQQVLNAEENVISEKETPENKTPEKETQALNNTKLQKESASAPKVLEEASEKVIGKRSEEHETIKLAESPEQGAEEAKDSAKVSAKVSEKSEVKANISKTKDEVKSKISPEEAQDSDPKQVKIAAVNNKINSRLKINDTMLQVKDEIAAKTDELKNIVKEFIEQKEDMKPEAFQKILQVFKQNINDFKVLNSISNQYYYMDVPLKLKNDEYQFKLIIKDDRKSEKKIDSSNVKIATSVKTINMGTVNIFLNVKNRNMNIDIKCNESWVQFLNSEKDILTANLSDLGYNTHVNIEKSEEVLDMRSCIDFFDDNTIETIDARA
jgi:hypothetical protein